MARTPKDGVDYFPLDTAIDAKLRAVIRKYGAAGYGTLVYIWQLIYADKGYYIKVTDDIAEDIELELKLNENNALEMIEFFVKRGIFERHFWENDRVLTSNGIQNRFLAICKRRKGFCMQQYNMKGVIVNINPINADIGTQSKVKESKEKVKESKGGGETPHTAPIKAEEKTTVTSLVKLLSEAIKNKSGVDRAKDHKWLSFALNDFNEVITNGIATHEQLSLAICWYAENEYWKSLDTSKQFISSLSDILTKANTPEKPKFQTEEEKIKERKEERDEFYRKQNLYQDQKPYKMALQGSRDRINKKIKNFPPQKEWCCIGGRKHCSENHKHISPEQFDWHILENETKQQNPALYAEWLPIFQKEYGPRSNWPELDLSILEDKQ